MWEFLLAPKKEYKMWERKVSLAHLVIRKKTKKV
jgi:hypothetical protein